MNPNCKSKKLRTSWQNTNTFKFKRDNNSLGVYNTRKYSKRIKLHRKTNRLCNKSKANSTFKRNQSNLKTHNNNQ